MINSLYKNVINLVTTLGSYILALFPKSPFRAFINALTIPYLANFAWIFPIGQVLTILAAWGAAISVYHLVSVVARWVKIIGD